jgi:hypothetical protein
MSSMGRRYTIKELPPELRPRERLLSEGAEALSSAELLGHNDYLFGLQCGCQGVLSK